MTTIILTLTSTDKKSILQSLNFVALIILFKVSVLIFLISLKFFPLNWLKVLIAARL